MDDVEHSELPVTVRKNGRDLYLEESIRVHLRTNTQNYPPVPVNIDTSVFRSTSVVFNGNVDPTSVHWVEVG